MGPFVVHGALHCEPRLTSLAFWTLCDLNDEVKKAQRFFQGGMGMFNYKGVPKPSYLAFQLLRRLGDEVLAEGENYIVARRGEEIQALVYNIAYLDHLAQANTDFTSDYEGDVYTLFEDRPRCACAWKCAARTRDTPQPLRAGPRTRQRLRPAGWRCARPASRRRPTSITFSKPPPCSTPSPTCARGRESWRWNAPCPRMAAACWCFRRFRTRRRKKDGGV